MAVDGAVTWPGSGHHSPGVCGPSTLTPFRLACPTNDDPFPLHLFFSFYLPFPFPPLRLIRVRVKETAEKKKEKDRKETTDFSLGRVGYQLDN